VLAGGHTIDDEEPKYGLSVMGLIHPGCILTKGGTQPGDVLILTKPLGVGIITTAFKGDMTQPAHVDEAVESMKRLNRDAARLIQEVGVHACTDITGFALLGHGSEMAEKSGAQLHFSISKLPFLEGALDYADMWLFPAGTCNNERAYEHAVHFAAGVSEEMQQLLYTLETSGGAARGRTSGEIGAVGRSFRGGKPPLLDRRRGRCGERRARDRGLRAWVFALGRKTCENDGSVQRDGCPGQKFHPSRRTALTSARASITGRFWCRD
jgi:selenide,water dikinase